MQYKESDIEVEIGYEIVSIKKIFGPMIFMDIRITPNPKDCTWKIERKTLFPTGNPECPQEERWVEFCSIPGQFEWEFSEKSTSQGI